MTLNIKNLFKKICILGASATMALGLCAPLANAAPPTSNTVGQKYDDFASIGGSDGELTPILSLGKKLQYNSAGQTLINTNKGVEGTPSDGMIYGVGVKDGSNKVLTGDSTLTNSGITMYLRAVPEGVTPTENDKWVLVWQNGNSYWSTDSRIVKPDGISLAGVDNVKGTNPGKYDIYYYIDGNDLYNSTTSGT